MRIIKLETAIPEEETEKRWKGVQLQEDPSWTILREDADVYEPDGTLLARLRVKAIPDSICRKAYPVFSEMNSLATNRGTAGGSGLMQDASNRFGASNTRRVDPKFAGISGIAGYFDRYVRYPYCRETAFTADQPARWEAILPYVQRVSEVFRKTVPDRWAAQKAICDKTRPEWIIPGTVFTTVTINKNWQSACHYDAGDYEPGFGVAAVLRAGNYTGGHLVLPGFGVGFDLWTGDVVCYAVHRLHGNTPFLGKLGTYRRISAILYYRTNMHRCGTPEEELKRARNRKPGDPIWDEKEKGNG